jgi:hypothetical protein
LRLLLSKLRRNLWNFWDLVASVGCDRINLQGMAGRGGTVGIMLRVSVRVLQTQRCPSRPAAIGTNERNLTVLPNGDVCTVLERRRNVATEECVVGNVGAWTERWDRRDITIIDHASRGGFSETDTKGRSAPDGGEAFEGTSPFDLLDRAAQLLLRRLGRRRLVMLLLVMSVLLLLGLRVLRWVLLRRVLLRRGRLVLLLQVWRLVLLSLLLLRRILRSLVLVRWWVLLLRI